MMPMPGSHNAEDDVIVVSEPDDHGGGYAQHPAYGQAAYRY